MKFFEWRKDGGPESRVSGLFLVEIKDWFSIVLLKFSDGSRDTYHSHAFNALSLVLWGRLIEQNLEGFCIGVYDGPCIVRTPRERFHKVISVGTTWALSFRGPWKKTWREYDPVTDRFKTLTDGRKEL